MAAQRSVFQHYKWLCGYTAILIALAAALWTGLQLSSGLLSCAGAAQLLPAVAAAEQLVKAAMAALVAALLYFEYEALPAHLKRLGAAAEWRLAAAARRGEAGSGGQQPSTP